MWRKSSRMLTVLGLSVVICAVAATAQEDKKPEFIGASKCKMCHSNVKMGGVEYLKWDGVSHSKAYQTLSTDKAKEAAAKVGVTDAATSEKCLKCHTTSLTLTTPEKRAEGVGCERCHGAGSLYNKKSVMEDHAASVKAGMREMKVADAAATKKNSEALCRECHGIEHKDENPLAKDFNFEESFAKIKHDEETLKKEFPEKFK